MPISTSVPIRVFDQESFHRIDHRVTGMAFDIHNEFGRYLEEKLYQREITRRCRAEGFEVEPELHITVSLDDFRKPYFADHLVNNGVILEVKAIEGIGAAQRGQTLNYLFLCGLHHATLLNFRTDRVQHEFVSTRFTPADRRQYEIIENGWTPLSAACRSLPELLGQMLSEWGACLDPGLYREGLTHFLGGKQRVVRSVAVRSGEEVIGVQEMHMLADDIAFSVTASTHRPASVFAHQQRFISHTLLRAIQWINLNHKQIEFRTIHRP